jgi:hypothetical protein
MYKKNKERILIFLAISAVMAYLLVILFRAADANSITMEKEVIFPEAGASFKVELAISPAERIRGLMGRKTLEAGRGMLFVFSLIEKQSFWMKNTLIPLDLVFLDSDYLVVDIKKNFLPCRSDFCEIYFSAAPAKYVLEINAGLVDEKGISIGQKAEIR